RREVNVSSSSWLGQRSGSIPRAAPGGIDTRSGRRADARPSNAVIRSRVNRLSKTVEPGPFPATVRFEKQIHLQTEPIHVLLLVVVHDPEIAGVRGILEVVLHRDIDLDARHS